MWAYFILEICTSTVCTFPSIHDLCSAGAAAVSWSVWCDTVLQALQLSHLWRPRYNSSRTSSSSFCDGHGRCISCVCVFVPCFLPTYIARRNEHIISRKADQETGRYKTHTSSGFKSNRAATVHTTTATAQRQCNSTSASTSGLWSPLQLVLSCSHIMCAVFTSRYHTCNHDHISTYNFKIEHTSSNSILSHNSSIQQYSEQIGTSHDDAPCLQLATLPGFQVNHIPKGGLVVYMTCESTATATKCPRGTS